MHMARILDDKAPNYLKQGLGWSYHAPCAGHDGIQIALGTTFRPGRDWLFPYYRDLATCLAAGITPEEILLNGMSKATDLASGGRHMSNHSPGDSRLNVPPACEPRAARRGLGRASGRTVEPRFCSMKVVYLGDFSNGQRCSSGSSVSSHSGQRVRSSVLKASRREPYASTTAASPT
jgi:TPP-dependent pyruvate/acetoin dehydrogenase alpha subunit